MKVRSSDTAGGISRRAELHGLSLIFGEGVQPPQKHFRNGDTLKAEGQVTGEAQQGHLGMDVDDIDIGDVVDPIVGIGGRQADDR